MHNSLRTLSTTSLFALLLGLAILPGCQSGDDSGDGGGGGAGGGGAAAAACTQSADCAAGEYCHFADYQCGQGQAEGACTPVPIECGYVEKQVCSCDGTVQRQDCPQLGRVDIAANGACTPPAGTFACGFTFCEIGKSYCKKVDYELTHPGVVTFGCQPLPVPCGGADECSCVVDDQDACGEPVTCNTDADGHAVVHCRG
ncbi:hypothetical protein WME90_47555 [Sorangium sp. So ce375]|uniref:hypothetical protein n=1 Tax=Sorangium sp. So ce375 TaxID=3133306 RepID=UPI003F5CB0AC